MRFIEVICSDASEHRRRVESREAGMPGHGVPTWARVQRRSWQPFPEPHLVLDNVGDPDAHADAVIDWLTAADPSPAAP
jgi:hypothetical protein